MFEATTIALFMLLQEMVHDQTIQKTVEAVSGTTAGVGLLDQLGINWLVVLLQQYMKKSNWRILSWITSETGNANRWISALLAALTAAGIHFTWQAEGGILTVSGLTLNAVVLFLWDTAKNFLGQKVLYKLAYSNGK